MENRWRDTNEEISRVAKARCLYAKHRFNIFFRMCSTVSDFLSKKLGVSKINPVLHVGCYVITYDGKSSCAKIAI